VPPRWLPRPQTLPRPPWPRAGSRECACGRGAGARRSSCRCRWPACRRSCGADRSACCPARPEPPPAQRVPDSPAR